MIVFSAASWLILYLILRTQRIQPLDPQRFTHSGPWSLSFNTASSFVSNTSWQYYAGETTLSDFAQMAGITVASFTSMAAGMAVAVALIRGLSRRGNGGSGTSGWTSFAPCSTSCSALVRRGDRARRPRRSADAWALPARPRSHRRAQTIAIGPVASQEAIKLLSGDGGGFFNVNSAHPFENPTAISNLIEMLLMLLVPAAFTATFGRMVGRRRQGWALYIVMIVMFIGGTPRSTPRRVTALRRSTPPGFTRRRSPAPAAATWKEKSSASVSAARLCSCRQGPPAVTAPSTAASSPTRVSVPEWRWRT